MLGLVCGLGGPMAPASELYREISVISQDPAHASALPMPLRAASFPGADRIASNVPLQVGSLRRDVAAFHPRYDPGRDAWYCDIEFETGEAYFPFVRLGLVRFQPKSLENCLVSAIVPTAFLQPLPDRTLTVIPQGADAVSVRLRGPAPQARHGIDDMTLLDTNAVVATVEVQEPGIEDAVLGWVLAGEEVRLEPVEQGALLAEWAGTVTLPADAVRPLRLAVREYELHPTDDRSGAAPVLVEGRRLVHADVVPLG